MADQGLWFKLWCSVLDDPDLDNLDLCDFARWAKLGTLVKRQGTHGTLTLRPPARALCAMLQVADFPTLLTALHRLPHVIVRRDNGDVSDEATAVVSFHNWLKYQGDYSTPRVRQFREMKRSKRRGEEKRREEKRSSPLDTQSPPDSTWPESVADVRTRLLAIEAPPTLLDPEYWTRIHEWLGPDDSGVAYLVELDKYLAWIAGLPKGQQRRDHRRGFRNWLSKAERWAQQEAQRHAQGQAHARSSRR